MILNKICFVGMVLWSLTSCSNSSTTERIKSETLEIFSTKGSAQDKAIDSLKYFEYSEYLGDRKINTSYFDHEGTLTGKEVITYDDQGHRTKGRYEGPNGQLLSYYDYICDVAGNVIAEYGFDASNNQLLAIKSFRYNNTGQVVERKVFEADYTPYRTYQFAFDKDGNESYMQVKDGRDSILFTEEFRVTATDTSGAWAEKWGFVNDVPMTYYKRSLNTPNKTNI